MSAPHFKDHEAHLRSIIDAALRAADPRARTVEALRSHPPQDSPFGVIAVGKGAASMWRGLLDVFPEPPESVIVVPPGVQAPPAALIADHPLPTERSENAAWAIEQFVDMIKAAEEGPTGFVVLLSGGASSLIMCPHQGLRMREVRQLTDSILRAGATIHELNCVRKHIDRLKGGKLAARMAPCWCDVFALSDVLGDDVSVIGSGPCAPDPTTYLDALTLAGNAMLPELTDGRRPLPESEVLDDLYDRFPALDVLYQGYRRGTDETPKPGDPIFDRVRHVIVANNETAVRATVAEAARLGYAAPQPDVLVQGEAAEVGRRLAAGARTRSTRRPACLVLGGETTVNVGSAGGKGGRNQELALAAAIEIDGVPNVAIATFATDGMDGPTDAAGAIVTGETCARARGIGLDPGDFLTRHDSHTFFERAGGHIKTGPTGTNVNDLAIALAY